MFIIYSETERLSMTEKKKLPIVNVIFDAGPLITACKFKTQGKLVIDHLTNKCQIIIPPSVEEEVAILGANYADGIVAGERIARGEIQVSSLTKYQWEQYFSNYHLGKGEKDSIELCRQTDSGILITDDYLAFIVAVRLGLKTRMLPDLVSDLAEINKLTLETATSIIKNIRPRYQVGIIEHNLLRLKEMK
jgi:predicted nucleic acid-binding protein